MLIRSTCGGLAPSIPWFLLTFVCLAGWDNRYTDTNASVDDEANIDEEKERLDERSEEQAAKAGNYQKRVFCVTLHI